MTLSPEDRQLSMRISPRSRADREGAPANLRTLLVHRLRNAAKAVLRLPMSANIDTADTGRYTLHCEPCNQWTRPGDWAEEFVCGHCQRVYALEFAVYSEIKAPQTEESL
ncbi:hypothetical protein [Streptomyces sp. NPDC088752]|uniref:hypothetical protein n=1 Tax=Streptomyces sp. NPDC088752 TaxID=3154963 RepID=UPI00342E9761